MAEVGLCFALGSTRLETAEDETTRRQSTQLDQNDFTQNELDLLGSKGIVRSPEGAWVHIEKYPDGRAMITPVNPHAELRRLREEGQSNMVLDPVNKNKMKQLPLFTQSRAHSGLTALWSLILARVMTACFLTLS